MYVGVANSCYVSLSKPYLRGISEELIDFATQIYRIDIRNILQFIKELCFILAKKL